VHGVTQNHLKNNLMQATLHTSLIPFKPHPVETTQDEVFKVLKAYMFTYTEFQSVYALPVHLSICCPYANGEYSALYIKLLRSDNYSPSTLEYERITNLRLLGNKCVVCYVKRYEKLMITGSRRNTILYHKLFSTIF